MRILTLYNLNLKTSKEIPFSIFHCRNRTDCGEIYNYLLSDNKECGVIAASPTNRSLPWHYIVIT